MNCAQALPAQSTTQHSRLEMSRPSTDRFSPAADQTQLPAFVLQKSGKRPHSILWHLALFGVGILVPVLVVAAIVAIHFASTEQARYRHDALLLARTIADDIDRELDSAIATAQSLALASALQRGDFAAFDAYAREIQKLHGNFIIVRDLAGQQLVNIRLPYGTELPLSTDPVLRRAAALAVETRRPVISDLFVGAVAKSLVLTVNVPVLRNGEPVYVINLTLTPERILAVMTKREIPADFIAVVLDGGYRIIARSIDHESSVGLLSNLAPRLAVADAATGAEGTWVGISREGTAVSAAHVRTQLANWRVSVSVPTAVLEAPLRRSLLFIAGLGAIGLGASFVLALLLGRQLSRPMRELAVAAASLGRGELVAPSKGGVREIEQVSEILGTASHDLRRQATERSVAQSLLLQSEERVRRMTEEALQHSEDRFRLLVDSVKDYSILMLDPDGIVATWSKGAERIKGYSYDEIVNRHFSIFYSKEDVAQGKPKRALEIAATEGRFEDLGWRVRKDGTAFWAEVLITPIHDAGGRLTGFSKLTRDVTERKRYETALQEKNNELQAAVKELDAFSYSVSHDLRAPLRAIDGFSQILLKKYGSALAEEPREYLQLVRDNTVQMGHLVSDLLRFSQLGRQPLSKQPVATAAIIEQILSDARLQAEGRSVNVSVGEMPDLWGDPPLLKQVFANLIQNAFKYTRTRAQAVIEIGSSEIAGERVFFVRDNGAGFDMQYADKLFGVFQRLHRAEDFEGTGVGLAIVQRIIERHGGRVWAQAALDQGATFYFTMECAATSPPA
jgi:PAS domain S-box-containing protein